MRKELRSRDEAVDDPRRPTTPPMTSLACLCGGGGGDGRPHLRPTRTENVYTCYARTPR